MPTRLYPPNTRRWAKGDLVIHYSDEKKPRGLMIVIGYTRDGVCKTRYIDPDYPREIYKNDLQWLLDPSDFVGIPYWRGRPVLNRKPLKCPFCGNVGAESCRVPDEDEYDHDLAAIHSKDDIRSESFHYIYEMMFCEDDGCGKAVAYGDRWYYNSDTNNYDLKSPLTPIMPDGEGGRR